MEESQKRIVKISRIIQYITNIVMALFALVILGGLTASFCHLNPEDTEYLCNKIIENANLLPTDFIRSIYGESNYDTQLKLAGFAIALGGILGVFLVDEFRKIFRKIVNSSSPFTNETGADFRKLSDKALLICLFSTIVGLMIFLLLRFLAYIFDYGTYLQAKADETNRVQEEMIMSFAEITENKSEQTGKHVRRVAEYSRIIAEEMGIDEDRAKIIRLASTMHDIGKLLIPAEILEKPGKLTYEEFQEIKKHPKYGGDLLNNVEGEVMHLARTVAMEHHERPDGRGYPEGKQDDSISIEGRIVAVADVYDALTSKRSYKQAWDEKDAFNEIIKGKGTQFDTDVVEAFERAYAKINEVRSSLQG